jgi:hypothetical protein
MFFNSCRTARTRAARFASLFFALSGSVACGFLDVDGPGQAVPGPEQGDLLVLFIGSSYFDVNDMPGIFSDLARSGGRQVYVRRNVISGYYLDYFAQSDFTEQVIQEQQWDYVLLQGGCQNAAYPLNHHEITPNSGYHPVYPALQTLHAKVHANYAGSKLVYMMPWAFEDGMTWVQGMTDTYMDMQEKIRDNVLLWADSLGIMVAPVGWAWRAVLAEGQEQHYLHLSDWNHPSWRGSYLSAAVIYSTVFVESAESLTYFGALQQEEAQWFLEVASHTVLDELESWNLAPSG